jgi:ketosteroid isomerase-like protein
VDGTLLVPSIYSLDRGVLSRLRHGLLLRIGPCPNQVNFGLRDSVGVKLYLVNFMTRSILWTSLVAVSLFAAEPLDAVREAASGWRQAVIKQDKAALERLLADDLTYTHANGRTQDKREYIAAITKGPGTYESFQESDTKIRVYHGKSAVLTGFVDVKLVGREPYRVRTIEVYVENGGRWQLTAKQSARINP